ncbi:hypothetical protein E2C01_026114 [Portunus trituberculatus]|uniref:Uncharacterized protein n=1 Tax=Portunus trituberculatus TaxID=210409 RepID=A0A5B7EHB2_PORTR|nr:hypothetical protein [Portunus trituberculatus]
MRRRASQYWSERSSAAPVTPRHSEAALSHFFSLHNLSEHMGGNDLVLRDMGENDLVLTAGHGRECLGAHCGTWMGVSVLVLTAGHGYECPGAHCGTWMGVSGLMLTVGSWAGMVLVDWRGSGWKGLDKRVELDWM